MRFIAVISAASLLAGAAQAEVTDKSAAGFQITHKLIVAAPAAKVYAALLTPAAWWNSQHSWSGDAKNLTMDLTRACLCEALPKGYARHMAITYADGAKTLRLGGALGPLQFTGAYGRLAVALKETDGKTDLTVTYDVGGYARGGLAEKWAAPVDGVLGEAATRLMTYVETGKPQ